MINLESAVCLHFNFVFSFEDFCLLIFSVVLVLFNDVLLHLIASRLGLANCHINTFLKNIVTFAHAWSLIIFRLVLCCRYVFSNNSFRTSRMFFKMTKNNFFVENYHDKYSNHSMIISNLSMLDWRFLGPRIFCIIFLNL